MSAQVIATETHKPLVAPLNPAAANQPIVSGSATTRTPDELGLLAVKEVVPLTIVDEFVFDGIGGFIAVESRRGLQKAFGGDTITTLSDGQQYVTAAELLALQPTPPEVLAASQERRDALKYAGETPEEKEARLKREKDEAVGIKKDKDDEKPLKVEPAKK